MGDAAKTYLDLLPDEQLEEALLTCSAALVLTDDVARDAIKTVVCSNGMADTLMRRVKNLECIKERWDGSWYVADNFRRDMQALLSDRLDSSTHRKLREILARHADKRKVSFSLDGQITEYRSRQARFEGGYQRMLNPDQDEREEGAERLDTIWNQFKESSGSLAEATARATDSLAEDLDKQGSQPSIEIHFLRGMAARTRGDRDLAREHFRSVWRRGRPGYISAVASHFYGNLEADEDRETAEEALRDSIKWCHSNKYEAHVRHSLGKLLADQTNRWDEAKIEFRKSVELDNSDEGKGKVYASWADLMAKHDTDEGYEKAKEYAERSLDLRPGDLKTENICYRVLAYVYEHEGDYGKAEEMVLGVRETNKKRGIHGYAEKTHNWLQSIRKKKNN